MLIAIPSSAPGGLDALVADHFGHCDAFTLVQVDAGVAGEVTVIPNDAHDQGGCMAPVTLLKQHGVDALIAGGMGMRPLSGFQQVGITVFSKERARTVREAVELVIAGEAREFGAAETCGGGEGHCGGHHHHHPVERAPIEGKADVQADRVVTFAYQLFNAAGDLLDASEDDLPARYLHGHGNIPPRLEQALLGLEAGAHVVVEVAAADAYGERDEAKVIEVPRAELPAAAEVGHTVRSREPDGSIVAFTVLALGAETATLDANHPFAGEDLRFDVTILAVEAATDEELAHGHIHG